MNEFQFIADTALASIDTLLTQWLPDGRRQGADWIARNPTRHDRHVGSFCVTLGNGRWCDYATGEGGGDLISLFAYIHHTSQTEAAQELASQLGITGLKLQGQAASPEQQAINQRKRQQAAQQAEQRKAEQQAAEQRQQAATAAFAYAAWSRAWTDAEPAARHTYVVRKGIKPYSAKVAKTRLTGAGLFIQAGDLLVPMHDSSGNLVNLQRINAEGNKRFLRGGQTAGAYVSLGAVRQRILICEGYATGASLHEMTGDAVACCLSASNLTTVALSLKQRYPDAELIVCGDDDRNNPANPGRKAATEAAMAAGCKVAFPEFPADAPLHLKDYNDLHQHQRQQAQGVAV